jgi:hypothetical protein
MAAGFVGIITNVFLSNVNGTSQPLTSSNYTVNAYQSGIISVAETYLGGTQTGTLAQTNSGTWSLAITNPTNTFAWGLSNSAATASAGVTFCTITYQLLILAQH